MNKEIDTISFKKAIADTSEDLRSILLGNGFSQSIWPKFSYRKLYKQSISTTDKWVSSPSDNLQKLFKILETHDFEKVISYLNNTITVIECYPAEQPLKETLINDKNDLIDSFIHALQQVHPEYRSQIDNVLTSTGKFLTHFSSIFSSNYDLLLYWIINYDGGLFADLTGFQSITDRYDDGFTYDKNLGNIWTSQPKENRHPQNTHYLHGSLFINDDNGIILKTKYNQKEEERILPQLKKQLMDGNNPLIVLEGTSETKRQKIDSNGYLTHCLDSLKKIDGSLFTFGFSFNKYSDQHITDAIQKSQVRTIYLGYYSDSDKKHFSEYVASNLTHKTSINRNIFLFDAREATNWESGQG